MHAEILVRINRFTLTHDKPTKRPVAIAYLEFPATRILEFIKATNRYFLLGQFVSSFQGATLKSSNMPGMASTVQMRKKFVQPVCSTMRPVVALAKTRGNEMSAVNSAN